MSEFVYISQYFLRFSNVACNLMAVFTYRAKLWFNITRRSQWASSQLALPQFGHGKKLGSFPFHFSPAVVFYDSQTQANCGSNLQNKQLKNPI